ncbi:MAG: hypothetical protein U5O69_08770 [Candidatus Competibacteraceae bacterium]|nr:hypothetical protein [Candidatus Competibacteraceae bacterium]
MLLAIGAVSGLLGIGLLSYEYYHTLQEQRQREAAALQRQQEEAAARRAQEETRQRQAEFAQQLEQARRAIADRAWNWSLAATVRWSGPPPSIPTTQRWPPPAPSYSMPGIPALWSKPVLTPLLDWS